MSASIEISDASRFEANAAESGGAIAMADTSDVTISNTTFVRNTAALRGGALFLADYASQSIDASTFTYNTGAYGGALYIKSANVSTVTTSDFTRNAAQTRGGAFFYESTRGVATSNVTCAHNMAPSGGCMFWLTYEAHAAPVSPCVACNLMNNTLYDIATNTRDVRVLWWPATVFSGVAALEPPDEESFKPMDALNASLAKSKPVWPRLNALDLYQQVEVLDGETECIVTPVIADDGARVDFRPHDYVTAVAGMIQYDGATFKTEPKNATYALQVTCTLPHREKDISFFQSVNVLPCEPGYSTDNEYVMVSLTGGVDPPRPAN